MKCQVCPWFARTATSLKWHRRLDKHAASTWAISSRMAHQDTLPIPTQPTSAATAPTAPVLSTTRSTLVSMLLTSGATSVSLYPSLHSTSLFFLLSASGDAKRDARHQDQERQIFSFHSCLSTSLLCTKGYVVIFTHCSTNPAERYYSTIYYVLSLALWFLIIFTSKSI